MSTTQRPHAVCPRIELNPASLEPKVFDSEVEALAFMNAELEPDSLGNIERVLGPRKDKKKSTKRQRRKGRLEARADEARKVEAGALHALAASASLQVHQNRSKGWNDPVPIRRLADYSGPKCARSLRDFFTTHYDVGDTPRLSRFEEVETACAGRLGDFVCFLASDWEFDVIEADAKHEVGHDYKNGRAVSILEIVVNLAYDLEVAFWRRHPDAPDAAVVDFWGSWQVQHCLAVDCATLAGHDTAKALAKKSQKIAVETPLVNRPGDEILKLFKANDAWLDRKGWKQAVTPDEIDNARTAYCWAQAVASAEMAKTVEMFDRGLSAAAQVESAMLLIRQHIATFRHQVANEALAQGDQAAVHEPVVLELVSQGMDPAEDRVGASTAEPNAEQTPLAEEAPATPTTSVSTTPPGVPGWDSITISFVSDFRVQVWSGSVTKSLNYDEFGFTDGRVKNGGEGKPNRAWGMLRTMAGCNGVIRGDKTAAAQWTMVEKRMQEIRVVLRRHFCISSDPVPFVRGTGYVASFKIGCAPSFNT